MKCAMLAAAAFLALWPQPLAAQGGTWGRVEIAAGVGWTGPVSFAPVAALETAYGGSTRALFDTSSRLNSSVGIDVMIGAHVTGPLRLEGMFAFTPTHLSTQVTADLEGISNSSADSPVDQYLAGGNVIIQRAAWGRRTLAPFVLGGAAYVRQLIGGRTLVQTGVAYAAGGGFYYIRPSSGGRLKATGLRLDLRALILRDGVVLDGGTHVTPAIAASVFARF